MNVRILQSHPLPRWLWTALVGVALAFGVAEPHSVEAAGANAISKVDVERTASGRAARVELQGSGGRGSVAARTLRRLLGASVVRSTLFEIRDSGDDLVFVGSGHGHGVGMSQWGAQAMAERGASYREILEAFYPGTLLERRTP